MKVVVNMGVGEALQDIKTLDHAVREMATDFRAEAPGDESEKIHRRV